MLIKEIEKKNYIKNIIGGLDGFKKKEFAIRLYLGLMHFTLKNYSNHITIL